MINSADTPDHPFDDDQAASAGGPLRVALLGASDGLARDSVVAGLLVDVPGLAVLAYEHGFSAADEPVLAVRRRLAGLDGVRYDSEIAAGSDCACCSVRADLVDTIAALEAIGRWSRLLVVLPLGAPLEPFADQICAAVADATLNAALAAVTGVVDVGSVEHDLLDDDLLAERGAELSRGDRRSVGEAICEQIDYADLVVGVAGSGPDPWPSRGVSLLSQLVGERWRQDWTELDPGRLFERAHDSAAARRRTDLRVAGPIDPDRDDHGDPHDAVWTLDLHRDRPVHPERLLAQIEEIGTGRIRARGQVWIASRPSEPCGWNGVGGQLSVGSLDGWSGAPTTRLVVTGVDAADRDRIAAAFETVLLTDTELTDSELAGSCGWAGIEDGLEPWLGQIKTPEAGAVTTESFVP